MSQQSKPIFQTVYGLLLYFSEKIDPKQKTNFLNLLKDQEIPYSILEKNHFSVPISQLIKTIENPEFKIKFDLKTENENNNPHSILFFSGFSRDGVEIFLDSIREEQYPVFPLKAVATKHNYNYTFSKLIQELNQDRTVISHVIHLRKRMNSVEQHISENDNLKQEDRINLEKELKKAEHLLLKVETDFELKKFKEQINIFNYLLSKIQE